jgi:hypothetical protein
MDWIKNNLVLIPVRGKRFFPVFKLVLGPTQPPVLFVTEVKLPGLDVDHLSSSATKVTDTWNYQLRHTSSWCGA